MKAPNGKATKLNERQWVQVRTKAFKKWFGDWEKSARIEKLKASKPIEISGEEHKGKYELNRDSAKQYIKDNLRGEYTVKDTGEKILLAKDGTQKVTSHSMGNEAHLKSIVAIPEMIENAIFVDELPNEKGNNKYNSYRYYVVGLKIGGVDYTAKLTVGIDAYGNKYYDHSLTEIEKGKLINEVGALSPTLPSSNNPALSEYKDTKLISILQNDASKVVDENGEPLVVWHGTNADFNDFKGYVSYFTDDKGYAQSVKGGRVLVPVFLDIRNPYMAHSLLSDVPLDVHLTDEFTNPRYIKNGNTGHDGVVGLDAGQKAGRTYVAFAPSQIKSATDNIGTYSDSGDIRFSKAELSAYAPKFVEKQRRIQKRAYKDYGDSDVRFSLGKRARGEYDTRLIKNRKDLSDIDRASFLDFLHTIDDKKTERATFHWFAKGRIIVPEDMPKVEQAIQVANKGKLDPMQYDSPMELIEANSEVEIKEKRIDPDTVSTLSNKVDYENGLTVYDVEDSEEGRKDMREIINTHFGKDRSPWCLLQGDENGRLTGDSKRYWEHYNGIGKRVAFHNGRLLAFSANTTRDVLWWDRNDESHSGIPITHRIPNDELGRTGTAEYNERTGEYSPYRDIHKGNRKNGLYKRWHDNGQLRGKSTYQDGNLHGLYETWHDNGQLSEKSNFKEGNRYGLYEKWWEQLYEKSNWEDNKRHGVTEYWDKDGQLKERSNYKNDKQHGLTERWNRDGQQLIKSNYKDGDRHGLYEEWNRDGQQLEKSNYRDGQQHGLFESWNDKGQLEIRANYKDGQQHGLTEWWYENGQLSEKSNWKDGEEHGLCEYWYGNGQLKKRYTINEDGDRHGLTEEWHDNGQLKVKSNYRDGQLHGLYESWHENGQLKERGNYKEGKRYGFAETWHENGQLREKFNYRDGQQHGLYESWNDKGQLEIRANYKNGKRHGLYESWHYNGQLEEKSNWEDGNRHGFAETWYDNGQLSEKSTYKNGKRHGLYEYWSSEGTRLKKSNYIDGKAVFQKEWDAYERENGDIRFSKAITSEELRITNYELRITNYE